jgi:predicted DNA-binding protein
VAYLSLDAASLPLAPVSGEKPHKYRETNIMKKKVLIAIPERLLDQLDLLAEFRSQTRSELIREACRIHLENSQAFTPARPAISLIHPTLLKEEAVAN